MTNRDENQIRERLEAKLAELTGNVVRRGSELIQDWSNDPMDQVQSREDLDMTVRFCNTDFQTKRAVETALKLLHEGEYGICQDCGEEINPKRLNAIPWTTLCVSCQEDRDSHDLERAA